MGMTNSGNKHVMSILSFVNVRFKGKRHWDRLELVPILSWFLFCPWLGSSNLVCRLQSQSPWSLFNGTWQKRPRELDYGLRFEIESPVYERGVVIPRSFSGAGPRYIQVSGAIPGITEKIIEIPAKRLRFPRDGFSPNTRGYTCSPCSLFPFPCSLRIVPPPSFLYLGSVTPVKKISPKRENARRLSKTQKEEGW